MKPGDLVCTKLIARVYPRRGSGSRPSHTFNEVVVGMLIELDPTPGIGPFYDLVLMDGWLGYVWRGALKVAE